MLTKLSLLISAALAATEVVEPALQDNALDFDDDFGTDELADEGDFGGFGDEEGGSIDSLLETLKGPNGENADSIEKLKAILSSGDESEESMAQLQALFDQILGQQASFEEDDAEL